jgi:hypothetical protein
MNFMCSDQLSEEKQWPQDKKMRAETINITL